MTNDKSTRNIIAGFTEYHWSKIVRLVRSKIETPEGMSVDDIMATIRDVYKGGRFCISCGASIKGADPWPDDEQADEALIDVILEMMNRIPERIPDGKGYENNAEHEFHAMRARFDSMSEARRDIYLEQARRLLRPFIHNNPDAVLFTALELMLQDETMKGVRS